MFLSLQHIKLKALEIPKYFADYGPWDGWLISVAINTFWDQDSLSPDTDTSFLSFYWWNHTNLL